LNQVLIVDELDKKILWELLKDARKSFTAIAKENDVSEDTVWKRYKEMEKKGIIVGATIQYNYKLFGYSAVATVRLDVESQNIDSVLDTLNNSPLIGAGAKVLDSLNNWPLSGKGAKGAVRIFGSPYTLSLFVLFENLGELEDAKEIITRQSPINGFDTNLWVDTRAIPQNIIGILPERDLQESQSPKKADSQEEVKLDEVDIQIVDKLSIDGRMTFGRIAKEIGVSTDTVIRRFERLKKSNYIKPILQIDPSKLGYKGFLVILIELSTKSYIKEMVDGLSKVLGVHDIIRLSSSFDLYVVAHVKGFDDIVAIHKEIAKIPHVKKVESAFAEIYFSWPPCRTPITTF
jgi:Lrp/AsnC family transcriptional regulator, regulator for asnA, asnC and gidA